MNATLSVLNNHVSVRHFLDKKIPQSDIQTLIRSAQSASSASFLQAYSIIDIEDTALREKIAKLAGNQSFIQKASHFFIFCADFYRLYQLSHTRQIDISATLSNIDSALVGSIDAALAAQNMAVAAEAMGLGICFVGGIRDQIEAISDLLQLPDYVFPVFGLAVGYPADKNELKPRLPIESIYFKNQYNKYTQDSVEEYNQRSKEYYHNRKGGSTHDLWSDGVFKSLKRAQDLPIKAFLKRQKIADE